MEKKTTRRIIGVLVVVALVIILLPLMFNGPETASPIQTSEAKAPPFPGTEIEANAASTQASNLIPPSQSGALINRIVAPSAQQQVPTPVAAETVASNASQNLSQLGTQAASGTAASAENLNMYTSDLSSGNSAAAAANAPMLRPINEISAANGGAENVIVIDSDGDGSPTTLTKAMAQADLNQAPESAAVAPPAQQPVMAAPVATPTVENVMAANSAHPAETVTTTVTKTVVAAVAPKVVSKPKVVAAKTVKTPVVKTVAHNTTPNNTPGPDAKQLAEMKKGWIVQLGSFKNKLNAERLTNSLRAKGYKAFTIETKSNGQTRVLVGPEFRQVAAATLASKIQQDINMRGIVMTYQPLAL
jgi:DedD protein